MPIIGDNGMLLSGSLWWLFIIDTVIIAAAGYVINDIYDQKADNLNKPGSSYVGNDKIPESQAWVYYGGLVVIGFVLAFYISLTIDKLPLLLIYPIASLFLYLYSWSFKKQPLIGNVVVAIFCAFVPGIILYAEWDVLLSASFKSANEVEFIYNMFLAYISFAFLSTMVREVVKDIEDVEGDGQAQYCTLPVSYGQGTAKRVGIFFNILLIFSFGFWVLPYINVDTLYMVLGITSVMLFYSLYILFLFFKADKKRDYTVISKHLKLLMIVSLFIFLCLPFLI